MNVSFHRASDLYAAITDAAHDASLPKLKLALAKPSLLILDDFGIGEMTAFTAQVLLDVVDKRMRTGALLITSQYPSEKPSGAHRIQMKGESMRKVRGRAALAEA